MIFAGPGPGVWKVDVPALREVLLLRGPAPRELVTLAALGEAEFWRFLGDWVTRAPFLFLIGLPCPVMGFGADFFPAGLPLFSEVDGAERWSSLCKSHVSGH